MLRLLSDSSETVDRLGFQPMADILVAVIRETPPPFTIGVFGEWGSGKTTMMTLVKRALEAEPQPPMPVKTVWFNAWKYDGKEVIWNALIQTIFYAIQNDPEAKKRTDDFLARVGKAAQKMALFAAKRATDFLPGGIIKATDVDEVVAALAPLKAGDAQFEFINRFEETFDALVKDYVGANGRLVVFIDDLDRCLPDNAIQVLEAIKLYLDRTNITFVVGAEQAVIEEGIRQRYKSNTKLEAKEYLEKIVQLPFHMRGLAPDMAQGLIDRFEKALPYATNDAMRGIVLAGTGGNPRRLKRFVNTFYVLSEMSSRAQSPVGDDTAQLAAVLLIQMRFPKIYEGLVRRPGLIAEFLELRDRGSAEIESTLVRREDLRLMHEDFGVRLFMDTLRELDCSAARMERWVLLAKGDGASMEGSQTSG